MNWSYVAGGIAAVGGALWLKKFAQRESTVVINSEMDQQGLLHVGVDIDGKPSSMYVDAGKWYYTKTNEKVPAEIADKMLEALRAFRKANK